MPLARIPGVGPDDWQPERSPLAEVNPGSGEIVFFEALAGAEATGAATPELLDQIAARSQMEVLGPVPDTYL